ncbi:MAG: SpoIIE family protein phosphatase [Planctomycetes bacterium]|nr:SpoIIE family protein phosphatase [Planctomycetota bacterium]
MPELLITLSDGRALPPRVIGNTPIVAGRDTTCDITLDDPSTSRRHARFTPTPEGYMIEDLGSKNGTLVNDVPCTSQLLKDGDQILAGAVLMVFRSHGDGDHSRTVVVEDDLTSTRATRYVSREQRLALPKQRLQLLYDLSARLVTLRSRDELLEDALDIGFQTLGFERGAVAIRRADSRGVDWPVVRNLRGREGELTISRSVLTRAMEYGERALFTDNGMLASDPTMSMVQQGIRSAMCVPLIHDDEILGVIYGDRVSTAAAYTEEDIDFFAGIAGQISIGLVNCRLMEEHAQTASLRRDVELARTIQTGMLPTALPNGRDLVVAALNEPGARISGDYYDVIPKGDGRTWLLIADVMGEGIAAALLMANLQAAVRVTIHDETEPAALLARWNRLICDNTDNSKFVTCLLALVDPNGGAIRLATAGHPGPIIVRDGAATSLTLAEPGFPLGIERDAEYTDSRYEGGGTPYMLFAYTDGVTEAVNPNGRRFGLDRLVELLGQTGDAAPSAVIEAVRSAVSTFVGDAPQSDDITMLAARIGH